MSEFHFKFREDARPADKAAVIDHLAELGDAIVTPLFPGEKDPELASLYVVACKGTGKTVLHQLLRERAIEFAEPVMKRKLIR